jgi:hypothetical protein
MRLRGQVLDAATCEPLAASVYVVGSTGHAVIPPDAIERRGSGRTAFYCDGEFELSHYATFAGSRIASNTRGNAFPVYFSGLMDIIVERGIEYIPLHRQIDLRGREAAEVELPLERWIDLRGQGWYPGNTHIHYDEGEQRPDERLHIEPRAHDLDLAALSILEKRGLAYASNKYRAGVLEEFSSPGYIIECGEEARHNEGLFSPGYGHVLLLRLRDYVEPISRGMLQSDQAPDFPPLTLACAATRQQGGVVIWAHNGNGLEAPIATALGKVDAINLFDYYWMEPEYRLWYHLLNSGLRLPASTGSDWFICNHNRVYVSIDGEFGYDAWWDGLLAGRTFITNGPALFLSVEGQGPGGTLEASPASKLALAVTWKSHRPIHSLDVIRNATVIAHRDFEAGSREGSWDLQITLGDTGWLAARCAGTERDSFDQPLFAHTSPVYLSGKQSPDHARRASAAYLLQSVDNALNWISWRGRFDDQEQRETTRRLFLEARAFYEALAR